MKHFIPLKKDFSNIKDVLNILKNDHITNQILKNAYNDLISSNYYSYSQFISFFDQNIEKELLNFESPFFQKGKSFKYDIFLFFDFTLIKIFQTIFSFLKVNFAKYHFPGRDKIKNMLGLNNKL